MSRRARAAAIVAAAALLPGCDAEYDNPFANVSVGVRIPEGADVLFVSNLHGTGPREAYAVDDRGGGVSRLTTCSASSSPAPCDTLEAVASPDRTRLAVRRGTVEEPALLLVDLARHVEGGLLPTNAKVTSVDWTTQDVIVYSGAGQSGVEDLYRMDANGQNNRNLTLSGGVRERRAKVDPAGAQAIYERIDATGKGTIWLFISTVSQAQVTRGGDGTAALAGTPYVEGSDADPDYSPDGRQVVFRRLRRATGTLGEWDLMTVRTDGTDLRTLLGGPAWRGAPDWGPAGIVFAEQEGSERRIVTVDAGGGGRRVLVTAAGAVALDYPRWLP